jgi:hypothetical protein
MHAERIPSAGPPDRRSPGCGPRRQACPDCGATLNSFALYRNLQARR